MPTAARHRPHRRRHRVLGGLCAAVVVALSGTAPGALADTGPVVVQDTDVTGDRVTLAPQAVRLDGTRATPLTVSVGTDAPGDVVVSWTVTDALVDDTGTVRAGAPVTPEVAVVGLPSRVRPGEAVTTTVESRGEHGPLVVVARVEAATTPGEAVERTDPPVELAALVLPGPPPAAPVITLARDGDALVGTVAVDAPLLVSVVLRGADRTELVERLVLPDRPLAVRAPVAGWPRPSAFAVTDETGRSSTVRVGTRDAALAGAGTVTGLLLVTLTALRRRRVRAG